MRVLRISKLKKLIKEQKEAAKRLKEQEKLRKELLKAQQEELKKAQQLAKALSDTVKDSFVDGIKAATDETRTLSDALANMLNRLSDQPLKSCSKLGVLRECSGESPAKPRNFGTLLGSVASILVHLVVSHQSLGQLLK